VRESVSDESVSESVSESLPPPPAPQDREPPRKRARAEAGSGGQQSTGTADIGGEEEERRRTHNVLERQRRNELKVCLTALRDQVPELAHNHKASKVLILRQAAQHISRLQTQQHRLSPPFTMGGCFYISARLSECLCLCLSPSVSPYPLIGEKV
uniref:BHLH domain-containing protein n=1 Tax=Callorhinchus milii TaxID=7868 RepID=A0A4W3GLV7_CALMI